MKRYTLLLAILIVPTIILAQRPEKVDTAIIARIKDEGFNRSQVMTTLSMITDVHGPRLTNSPGYKKAAEYAKATLESWGLQNVHFDDWGEDFGKGWYLKKFSLQELEPVYTPVIAYAKAWSPGVKGPVTADAVYLDVKTLDDLAKYSGKLKGKLVLFSQPTPVSPGFKPDAERLTDAELLTMSNAAPDDDEGNFRFNMESARLNYAKWEFCMKEGALAVLEASSASRLEDGTVAVQGATVPSPPEVSWTKRPRVYAADAPKILPQVVVAAENYNRMVRQIEKGNPVKLELTMETEFTPVSHGFNIIGEIPGTDLKDEVVMIGAHFDSWHGGTGATDNGSGSAVMMEAMRLLKSIGKNPRRTIRIALWGGEEQGLIGSRSYVKRTFGERLDKTRPYDSIMLKPQAAKFSVYLNMDNGTGKYRGVYLQGNEAARPVFRTWLKPFESLGASTLTIEDTGGTDHLSFDAIGLPGFQFIQDPIEYSTRTHHTTMDVFDKAIEGDLENNAVITASFAWIAANRDGLFPRKGSTPLTVKADR